MSGIEARAGPRFQAQPLVTAPLRFFEDVLEHRCRNTFAQMRLRGAHRLYFSVFAVEFLQGAAAVQFVVLPERPERDIGRSEAIQVQGMDALRRRMIGHALQVLVEKSDNPLVLKIAGDNFHTRIIATVLRGLKPGTGPSESTYKALVNLFSTPTFT